MSKEAKTILKYVIGGMITFGIAIFFAGLFIGQNLR